MLAIFTRIGVSSLIALTIMLSLTDAHPSPLRAGTSRISLTPDHAGINLISVRTSKPAIVAALH